MRGGKDLSEEAVTGEDKRSYEHLDYIHAK